jgi:hypothetical protein
MKAKFGSKKGKREHASINHNEIDEQQRNIVLISTRSSRLRHAMPCYHQIFFLSCFILISTQTCLLLSHPLFHLHQFNPARRETNDQSKQTVNKHEKQRYENETKKSNSIYVSPTLTTKISCISAQRESIHKIQTENQIKSNLKLKCEKRSSGERERGGQGSEKNPNEESGTQSQNRNQNKHATNPTKHQKTHLLSLGSHLGRRNTDTVGVTVEEHTLALTSGALGRLDEVADTGGGPEGLEEASPAGVSFGAVVVAHDFLDGVAGLVGVVEGDVADVVVQHVGLNDAVEDVAADEAEVTVDGCSGATSEVPDFGLVVGEGGIGVLEEGDGD